jgi:hypothetical protein
MPLRPPIPLIGSVLGGSVISEEYKGDFAQAHRIADATFHDTRGHKT